MGLAATQVRLMQLTSRNNDIGLQLQHIALQKQSLTREMNKISEKYQEALNTKTLKWSNNAGVSYMEITYSNLMTQSALAQNNPQMLTNNNGKIVVDSRYLKYAQMISPDGSSGGTWDSTIKNQIIYELTDGDIMCDFLDETGIQLDSARQNLYNFYDRLFSTIAEKGWVYDSQVNDPNYLNNSLQNGSLSITTVKREVDEEKSITTKTVYSNTYDTNIASNCYNIFQINDADARKDAQVAYEDEKRKVNMKEARLDARSEDLQTEQAAIKQMIQGLEAVRTNSIETVFNTFA